MVDLLVKVAGRLELMNVSTLHHGVHAADVAAVDRIVLVLERDHQDRPVRQIEMSVNDGVLHISAPAMGDKILIESHSPRSFDVHHVPRSIRPYVFPDDGRIFASAVERYETERGRT